MPRRPQPAAFNWPTFLVAGLLVVGTGGFIADQKGWIPPEVWQRTRQALLAISGSTDKDATPPADEELTASLGSEAPSEPSDQPEPLQRELPDGPPPARIVRPRSRTLPPDDLFSELPDDQTPEHPPARRPKPPSRVPGERPNARGDSLRETAQPDTIALQDGDAFAEDVTERAVPAPSKPQPPAAVAPNARTAEARPAESSPDELMELTEIEQLLNDEQDVKALQELTRRYWKVPSERETLRPRMEELSTRIFFSPQPHYFEPHVIQANEQLRNIAKKYSLSWEYLARLNNADPKRIRYGQRLKVVPGPFHVLVNIRAHELIVHTNGCYVKRYRVGCGKDRSTPVGTFKVLNKMVNPTYYGPEGVIKADDPVNPLGERWIDIGDSYGIHGTHEPDSIGQDKSRGCVRMLNEDVAEVYDFLIVGGEVKIQK
jgi:LysM repeat protein